MDRVGLVASVFPLASMKTLALTTVLTLSTARLKACTACPRGADLVISRLMSPP